MRQRRALQMLIAATALLIAGSAEAAVPGLQLYTPTFATLITVGGGGHTIEDEGSALTQRTSLNFVGGNISCSDSGGKTVCTLTGATLALDNLASVSINASLIPQSAKDLGAQATPWRDAWLYGSGTFGTNSFRLTGTPTAHRVLTLPDTTTTLAGLAVPGQHFTNTVSFDQYATMAAGWGVLLSAVNADELLYNQALTPDSVQLLLGNTANSFHIAAQGTGGADYQNCSAGTSSAPDPLQCWHSRTAGTTEWVDIKHNTTQPVMGSGKGPLALPGGANVASAATITPTGTTFHVTGTTNIDTMTIMAKGTVVTMIFDGILTVGDGTGNFKLSAGFTTSADDVLTVVSDGTSWFEMGRSAN